MFSKNFQDFLLNLFHTLLEPQQGAPWLLLFSNFGKRVVTYGETALSSVFFFSRVKFSPFSTILLTGAGGIFLASDLLN